MGAIIGDGYRSGKPLTARQHFIWEFVSRSPLRSQWNLQGVSAGIVAKRTWESLFSDRLFGRAAELGFYFLFALFPTLFSASSILGLAARSASQFYDKLLAYLSLVIPTSALGTVLATFNETTAAATSGKLTFGLVAAIWSASVGISAIQDALNAVYKVQDTRSFLRARIHAIGLSPDRGTRHGDIGLKGQCRLDLVERRIARHIAVAVAVRVDDDIDEIRIVESRCTGGETGVVEMPVWRP